ncbi:unnamed protein product [Notodromas monacha]|uniref:Uncharacterized protein n=1 Tax=Notodromas monacha TaxID=399045 RepID=A0A7R9GA45_9CRUS|nr:unnamed protein product [Notodromas monacha]CAG0913306.1 unnamed protein product [Notodromas monacha]
MWFYVFVGFIQFYLVIWRRKILQPIFDVYHREGRWYPLKYAFMLSVVTLRRWKARRNNEVVSPKYDLDPLKPLQDHPKAIDATYINAASHDGKYLVVGTARRPHGVLNSFLVVKIPGVGLLESPKIPDTMLFQDETASPYFGAEGISLTMLKPLEEWAVNYDGKMRLRTSDGERSCTIQLRARWVGKPTCFDFDTDLPVTTIARNISKEPWSREYFQILKERTVSGLDDLSEEYVELSRSIEVGRMGSGKELAFLVWYLLVIRLQNKFVSPSTSKKLTQLYRLKHAFRVMTSVQKLKNSANFFFNPRYRSHQSHIEQMGRIRGTIVVDGVTHTLDLDAFRDRSHGKFREWKNIHRYAFNLYHLEDGSHFQAAFISHVSTCSQYVIM